MITVDTQGREHEEIEPLLRALNMRTTLEPLPAGDFQFEGYGPGGMVLVGFERKRIKDLLGCMRDGRLAGEQLPKMFDLYDYSYLIVEGVIRANPESGLLESYVELKKGKSMWLPTELGRARFMWSDLDHYLATLEHSKLKIIPTDNMDQTAHLIRSRYGWWRDKQWHEHKSLGALYSAPYAAIPLTDKDNLVRRVAKEFSGIGVEKSLAVSMRFRNVEEMVLAPPKDWQSVPGIGKGISTQVWHEIRGLNAEESQVR